MRPTHDLACAYRHCDIRTISPQQSGRQPALPFALHTQHHTPYPSRQHSAAAARAHQRIAHHKLACHITRTPRPSASVANKATMPIKRKHVTWKVPGATTAPVPAAAFPFEDLNHASDNAGAALQCSYAGLVAEAAVAVAASSRGGVGKAHRTIHAAGKAGACDLAGCSSGCSGVGDHSRGGVLACSTVQACGYLCAAPALCAQRVCTCSAHRSARALQHQVQAKQNAAKHKPSSMSNAASGNSSQSQHNITCSSKRRSLPSCLTTRQLSKPKKNSDCSSCRRRWHGGARTLKQIDAMGRGRTAAQGLAWQAADFAVAARACAQRRCQPAVHRKPMSRAERITTMAAPPRQIAITVAWLGCPGALPGEDAICRGGAGGAMGLCEVPT